MEIAKIGNSFNHVYHMFLSEYALIFWGFIWIHLNNHDGLLPQGAEVRVELDVAAALEAPEEAAGGGDLAQRRKLVLVRSVFKRSLWPQRTPVSQQQRMSSSYIHMITA